MTQQRKFAILPVLALLTACSQNVEVKPSFPDPLAEALPITVGVHYTAELTDFSYNEELPGDTVDWTFNIGSANQLMFEKTFGAVFDELLVVDNVRANNVDVVLQPTVQALEFALPRQTSSDQYAVWIRYNIKVYTPDGELRQEFPVPGYGEVDSRRLKGKESMREATVWAMRDAASIIIDSLSKDTGMRRAVMGTPAPADTAEPTELVGDEAGGEPSPAIEPAADPEPLMSGQEFRSDS